MGHGTWDMGYQIIYNIGKRGSTIYNLKHFNFSENLK